MHAEAIIGCLILFTCHTLVSTLCSTCLGKQCYENGECIIGCVPGYVGEYCNEACPSRCLNKVCYRDRIDGTITCTDRCQQGFCGIQCSESCPEDCVTCDRKCGSCNVTLCRERHYGANCTEICSPKYGKCDRETGQCIICRRGYYGDECNQKCTTCFTRAKTIIDNCLSGCDICQSKETCPTGFHGDSCELLCSSGCADPGGCNRATGECSTGCMSGYDGLTCNFMCSEHCVSGICNKATGECSDGCVSGYHGLTCNYTCSEHCLSGICNKATGECSIGCVSGHYGLTCNETCNKFCVGGICNQLNGICTSGCVTGYISNLHMCDKHGSETTLNLALHIVLVFIGAGTVIGVVFVAVVLKRRLRRRSNKRNTQHDEKENDSEDTEPFIGYDKDTETVKGLLKVRRRGKTLQERTEDEIIIKTEGMVRVSALDTVVEKLNAGQRWITISGNAGDGKTTLGYLVLKEFLQKNYKVFTLYKPEEYDQIAKIDGKRMIMFDDRFGAFLADEHLVKSWFGVIRTLFSFNEHDMHVIFVSRKNVVNESIMYLGQFVDKMFNTDCVVDLSERKMPEERLKILDYHLQHENVIIEKKLKRKVANKETAHGFPHCCKMYSKLRSNGFEVDIEEFFESPLKFLDMTTKVLYRDNCKDLFQLMIRNDGQFDVFSVEDEDERKILLRLEKEQEGSYITLWKNGICQFVHPSVYESVLNVINEIDPLYCVQYATLSVIRQKMIISTSDEEDSRRSPCYIIIKPIPAVLKALAERFRQDVLKGDYSVFKHRLCESVEFCEALVSCCEHTEENEDGSKRLINLPGKDGNTMLWTALKNERMFAVQTLVKAQADVNMQDNRGRTPLHYLFQLKNSPADGVATDAAATDAAGAADDAAAASTTASAAADDDDDADNEEEEESDNGAEDEHYGVIFETIQVIITVGKGNVNISDHFGNTPLHYLFQAKAVTRAEIYLTVTEAKGDLNKCEQNKSTPLHHLCANSDLKMDTVDLLIIEGKGDFNKGDEYGSTPLHYLCGNKKVDFDVVLRVVHKAKGAINKQDHNGITPLHLLIKATLQPDSLVSLIKQGNKADRCGNTPLHYLCRRKGINGDVLEQIPETEKKKQNIHGYSPLDFFADKDDRLPWIEGILDRSAADLVVCRFQKDDTWITVKGPAMILSSQKVNKLLQVEDFNQELTNMAMKGNSSNIQGRFSKLCGTCCIPSTLSSLTVPSYWESHSNLKWNNKDWKILLEMGVVDGEGNLDRNLYVSDHPRSVCVSVRKCQLHIGRFCIQQWRMDLEDKPYQVGECTTLALPTIGEVATFKFGMVVDVTRGRVGFIDVERGKVLSKVEIHFTEDVFPIVYIRPRYSECALRMRLVSGREISVNDSKIHLIQQALSN